MNKLNLNPEVIKNAELASRYWAGETEDKEPYTPANGSEGDWFESNWCEKCQNNETCEIVMQGHCGEQPKEWYHLNSNPICEEFKPINLQLEPAHLE